MRHRSRLFALSAVLIAVLACHARAQAGGQAAVEALPPGGYGSLKQDDLALRVRTAELDVRFVPLDLRVTSLLGRDSYQSLHSLVQSRRQAIDSLSRAAGIGHPGLALVTFYGRVARARFDPQLVSLQVRGHPIFPLGMVPIGPGFSNRELGVRGQARAIYVFEEIVPVIEPFTLSYGTQLSAAWESRIQLLSRERGRAVRRAQAADTTTAGER